MIPFAYLVFYNFSIIAFALTFGKILHCRLIALGQFFMTVIVIEIFNAVYYIIYEPWLKVNSTLDFLIFELRINLPKDNRFGVLIKNRASKIKLALPCVATNLMIQIVPLADFSYS